MIFIISISKSVTHIVYIQNEPNRERKMQIDGKKELVKYPYTQ